MVTREPMPRQFRLRELSDTGQLRLRILPVLWREDGAE